MKNLFLMASAVIALGATEQTFAQKRKAAPAPSASEAPAASSSRSKTKGVPVSSRKYGAAGCGLGSSVMGNTDGFGQVFAMTTNGSTATDLFGITTGTSNCVPTDGMSSANLKEWMPQFLAANRDQFESDLVRGNGETVRTLTWAAGCAEDSNVGIQLQKSHDQLLGNDLSAEELSDRLLEQLSNLSCKNVG